MKLWGKEEKWPWPEEIENQVNPIVQATERSGRDKWGYPVKVDLKPGVGIPKRQYPLQKETLEGICPIIQKFQEYGLPVQYKI